MAALKEPDYALMKEYERQTILSWLMARDNYIIDPPPPLPWYKRLGRYLHPVRTFKDWLHRDCGDY